jgi:2-hydroxychromene-2-carboxylate isomerase
VFRGYHDLVFDRFWKRELDIEDAAVLLAVLAEAGADTGGLPDFLAEEGPRELDAIHQAAHEAGVFGVPSFVIDGELFWGREHLPAIRDILRAG